MSLFGALAVFFVLATLLSEEEGMKLFWLVLGVFLGGIVIAVRFVGAPICIGVVILMWAFCAYVCKSTPALEERWRKLLSPPGTSAMLTELNALLEVRKRIERRLASIRQSLGEALCKGEFGRVSELENEQSEVTACLEAADWHIDWLEGFRYPRSWRY